MFIVADGVGGHRAGAVASHWAVETVKGGLADLFYSHNPRPTIRFSPDELSNPHTTVDLNREDLAYRVEAAVRQANHAVRKYARQKPGEAGNADTTLSMAMIHGRQAFIANVGDRRVCLLRDRQLRQITTDHSLVQQLIEKGVVEPNERSTHPQRNLIYRSLGAGDNVEIDVFHLALSPGDFLLLCTDGLWEMLHRSDELIRIILESPSVYEACPSFIAAANTAGGEGNIGVVVVKIYDKDRAFPARKNKADTVTSKPSLEACRPAGIRASKSVRRAKDALFDPLASSGTNNASQGSATNSSRGTAIKGIITPLFWIATFKSLRTIARIARFGELSGWTRDPMTHIDSGANR